MKSLREYLEAVELGPQDGDAIDIVLNEEVVVETDIVDVQGTDIFIGLDQRAYDMLEASGMISEQTTSASGTISGLTSDAMQKDPRYQAILQKELARAGNSPQLRQSAYSMADMRYRSELLKNPGTAPAGVTVTADAQPSGTAAPAAKTAPAAPAAMRGKSGDPTQDIGAAAPAATPAAKPAAGGYKGSAGAQAIQAANPDIIKDVNKIQAGQKIKLPNGQEYTIQPGDTLDKIARTQSVTGTNTPPATAAAPASPTTSVAGGGDTGEVPGVTTQSVATARGKSGDPNQDIGIAQAPGDAQLGSGIKTSQGRNLDRVQRDLARMRKNAGMSDQAGAAPAVPGAPIPPAASTVPNPWQGKDPAKAAAFAKLSPEDQKWIGSADPTDPSVLARAPSQPGIGQQIGKGVSNIGQGIKNIFSPKAKPAAPATAPAAPQTTPTINTESADFDRMLELAGLDKKKELNESVEVEEGRRASASTKLQRAFDRERARSEASRRCGEEVMAQARLDFDKKQAAEKNKDKDVKEGLLDIAKGAYQGAKAARAAKAAPKPAAPAPSTIVNPQTGKPFGQSPAAAPAAPPSVGAASGVPTGVDPMVWAKMTPGQQQNYISRQAKELGKGDPGIASRAAKAAVRNPVKTAAVGVTGYYLYNNPEVLSATGNFAQKLLGPRDDTMDKAEANLNNIAKNLAEQGKSREEIISALSDAAGGADPATNEQWGRWAGRAADSAMRQANRKDTPDAPGSHVQRMRPSYDLSIPQPATNESRYQVYARHPVTGSVVRINLAAPEFEKTTETKSYFEHYTCGQPRMDQQRWSTRTWLDTPISKIMKGKQQ